MKYLQTEFKIRVVGNRLMKGGGEGEVTFEHSCLILKIAAGYSASEQIGPSAHSEVKQRKVKSTKYGNIQSSSSFTVQLDHSDVRIVLRLTHRTAELITNGGVLSAIILSTTSN